jgi:hypothetical protein
MHEQQQHHTRVSSFLLITSTINLYLMPEKSLHRLPQINFIYFLGYGMALLLIEETHIRMNG